MIHQGLENKDILSHIFKFFNKTEDKQSIFNLASCNKRINRLMDKLLNNAYVYRVTDGNIMNISSRYKALRVNEYTLTFGRGGCDLTFEINKIITKLDTINDQIKMNTLESLNISSVIKYNTVTTKTLHLMTTRSYDYDMYTMMCALDKYNIQVDRLEINGTHTTISSNQIVNKYSNLQSLHMVGDYDDIDINKNYDSIKHFSTNVPSLYLFRCFKNIVQLDICPGGEYGIYSCDASYLRNILVLPNLKDLSVDYTCNINLQNILDISPNLNTITVSAKDKVVDLTQIEATIISRCSIKFISLTIILKSSSHGLNNKDCTWMIFVIAHRYIDIIGKKYKNYRCTNFCGYSNTATDITAPILEIEQTYSNLVLPTNNTLSLYHIILYAYKIVCLYVVGLTDDKLNLMADIKRM